VIVFFLSRGAIMTFHPTIKELDDLGERFHKWKQNNPYRHVPKDYWDDALKCTVKYGPYNVAQSIGYSASYIIQKQRKGQSAPLHQLEFVEIQPSQTACDLDKIQMNIQNHRGVAVELSFQGSVEQIFPLISSLFKESACSR
jgi:hypothetical protein